MDRYTEFLDSEAETLSPDDENYEEKLLNVAKCFRTFNEALSRFICEHGFDGDFDDNDGKLQFLYDKFRNAGIAFPRKMKEWFNPKKSIKRDTAFQICFAFALNVDETNDFFKKVYFERSFDCHSINEAVYYYCIRNGLTYQKALDIIALMPEDKKGPVKNDREILYTGTIIDFINGVKDENELVAYINQHYAQFGYNNATAKKHIQELWNMISEKEGIAYKEGCLLDKGFNQYHSKEESDEDDYITVECNENSTWKIYSQILGLDKYQTMKYGVRRSIKPLLENNILLPPLAEASFPDRDGIEKITSGAYVSHERIRKLLILLEFYVYWANEIIKNNNAFNKATKIDSDRCIDKINSYLLDAGYSELYPGNPYDWIFLWAVNDSCPLIAFRSYMSNLFAAKDGLSED